MTASKKELILVLPYLGKLSFKIRKRIQCSLKKNAPIFNLKVVFQSTNEFYVEHFTNSIFKGNYTFKEKIS